MAPIKLYTRERSMNYFKKSKSTGFSLLELMVTVAILAIIISIAVPNYRAYGLRTNRSEGISNLLQMTQWMERQFTTFGSYNAGAMPALPVTQSPPNGAANYNIAITANAATTYTLTATPAGNQVNDTCGVLTISESSLQCATILGVGTLCSNDGNAANRTQVSNCFGGR